MALSSPGNELYSVTGRCLGAHFPPTAAALDEPNGLLAVGGDLSTERLLAAYRRGIFPWYSPGQPILWWSPDPRTVLVPADVYVSRSLAKTLRQRRFEISLDRAFADVVSGCAAPRAHDSGTWITDAMAAAYTRLHEAGFAHSLECWRDGELCGGIYGVAMGRMFFGESMFSRVRDASKVALVELCRRLEAWDYVLLDCQVDNPHLATLGAASMPRTEFESIVERAVAAPVPAAAWRAQTAT